MSEQTSPTGSIYDLGYRPYDGERLGRRYAIQSLYIYSLRAIFGIGRSVLSKVFPFGLAILALLPAGAQLAIAALAPLEVELIRPEDYFSYVQIVLALFCAVVTPEIMGKDQRNRTLPLYFSRALSRADYVSAKLAALILALFAVQVLPQILLYVGSAVATQEVIEYLKDDAGTLFPVIASALVVSLYMGSISLAIASQTSRRAFATGAVLAYFVIFTTIGSILANTTTGDVRTYSTLISPIDVLDGTVRWLFNADIEPGSNLAVAGTSPGYLIAATFVYSALALGWLYRRFQRLAV